MAEMNFRLDETPPGMRPQPSSVGRVAAAEKSTPSRRGKAPHLPVRQPGRLTVVSPEALRTALAGGVPLSRDESLHALCFSHHTALDSGVSRLNMCTLSCGRTRRDALLPPGSATPCPMLASTRY